MLFDDSRRYVERATAADVDAKLDVWIGIFAQSELMRKSPGIWIYQDRDQVFVDY